MRPLVNEPEADSGDAATTRRAAPADTAGEGSDPDPHGDRDSSTPEEEGYGYGV